MASACPQPLASPPVTDEDKEYEEEEYSTKDLPSCLVEKAERELNEKASLRARELQEFREAVQEQPDLKSRTDDNFLLRFLRSRKFDQQKALELLINYYKQRQKYPELYSDLLAASMPHVLATPNLGPLRQKDSKGRTVFVFNTAELWDPSVVSVDDCLRYCLLSFERILQEEEPQISGVVIIMDCKGFGLRHLVLQTPSRMAKMVSVSLSSFPMRFKGAHVINAPAFFRTAYSVLKPFLPKKVKERFILYNGLETFHERFDPQMLPKEFGGTLGPFENAEWNRELLVNDRIMKMSAKFGFLSDFA